MADILFNRRPFNHNISYQQKSKVSRARDFTVTIQERVYLHFSRLTLLIYLRLNFFVYKCDELSWIVFISSMAWS